MSLRDRLTGRDPEERTEAVRRLHAAMTRAADDGGSPEALEALFGLLAGSKLWMIDPRGGSYVVKHRADNGERFVPAATTRARMRKVAGRFLGEPLVQVSFPIVAFFADHEGADSLVINPGTVPMGHLARPVLETFADGAIPDATRPEAMAHVAKDRLGPLELIQEAASRPRRNERSHAGETHIRQTPGERMYEEIEASWTSP